MPHIAIYVRVSTKRQDTISQEDDLNRWVALYASDQQVVWYRDKFTGKTMDRPGWNSLHDAMSSGKASKVVVWRLDRLGRTAAGLTALFEEFLHKGVEFESLRDKVDLSTPAGRLLANVLASVAAYETEVRRERIMAGQDAARARGKKWGGSPKGRRLKVTEEQIATIWRMVELGETKVAMAKATGLHRDTIYRLIETTVDPRPAYVS